MWRRQSYPSERCLQRTTLFLTICFLDYAKFINSCSAGSRVSREKRNERLELLQSLRGQDGKRETGVHHRAVRDALPEMHREARLIGVTVVRSDELCVRIVLRGHHDAVGPLDRTVEDDTDLSQGSSADHF